MKKILSIILMMFVIIGLSGCDNSAIDNSINDRISALEETIATQDSTIEDLENSIIGLEITISRLPDNDTVYNDNELLATIAALELQSENSDILIRNLVTALENNVYTKAELDEGFEEIATWISNYQDSDTVYDDTEIKNLISALVDNDTVYDDELVWEAINELTDNMEQLSNTHTLEELKLKTKLLYVLAENQTKLENEYVNNGVLYISVQDDLGESNGGIYTYEGEMHLMTVEDYPSVIVLGNQLTIDEGDEVYVDWNGGGRNWIIYNKTDNQVEFAFEVYDWLKYATGDHYVTLDIFNENIVYLSGSENILNDIAIVKAYINMLNTQPISIDDILMIDTAISNMFGYYSE